MISIRVVGIGGNVGATIGVDCSDCTSGIDTYEEQPVVCIVTATAVRLTHVNMREFLIGLRGFSLFIGDCCWRGFLHFGSWEGGQCRQIYLPGEGFTWIYLAKRVIQVKTFCKGE